MKILVANKFWYTRGGLERVMFDEIRWLEDQGHDVAHFSTRHPRNVDSAWAEYFAPYYELGESTRLGVGDRLAAASRLFSNRDAQRCFGQLLDEFRPDIIHVHGIHRHLSPSILSEALARRVPTVQTLHDYHHVCPGDVLLRAGSVPCEPRACGRLLYCAAVGSRCVRGSVGASVLSAMETSYQRGRRIYERAVARFISPSAFMAAVMRQGEWRIPCDVVPNALSLAPRSHNDGAYVLYAGRLSPEKGVAVLLDAARLADVPVIVAGEGPSGRELRERFPQADFRGCLDGSAVQQLMMHAMCCAVPSVCYENAPMSILEPMAAGVPVVASSIGGIPEIVEHERVGLLVPPGDAHAMARAIERLRDDGALRVRLGSAGRQRVAATYSPERHVGLLLETYRKAITA